MEIVAVPGTVIRTGCWMQLAAIIAVGARVVVDMV
jgi:hypothetical protein